MAGLNHQLKASTLVESLIAMVILIVCLGIGTMVFTNVLNSDRERKQLHATLLANEEAIKIKFQKNYLDSEEKVGDWTLKKTVEKYEATENLFLLSIAVLDNNSKIVFIRHELIIVE
jgi:Tfp pilus assembly protein PilE